MRGKIIHYNASDAKGLINAAGQQYSFDITVWKSDTAPVVNSVVEFEHINNVIQYVELVSDDVILKEKATELAGKIGVFSGKALGDVKAAADSLNFKSEGSAIAFYGKPLLIAYGIFAFSAIFLPFVSIGNSFGIAKSFSLIGISEIQQLMGASLGFGALAWVAILAVIVPYVWRSKFSWLLLLLPILAVLQPVMGLMKAISNAKKQMGEVMGSDFGLQMADEISSMIDVNFGAIVCLVAALVIAIIGIKRFILSH